MQEVDLVLLAKTIAIEAHAGQFRRDGETPYIIHPAAVAALVSPDARLEQVAWLHDVLEDCAPRFTPQALLDRGVPYSVVAAVRALTHTSVENYGRYLERVAQNPLARAVKIADIVANLSDKPTAKQIRKYHTALRQLAGG